MKHGRRKWAVTGAVITASMLMAVTATPAAAEAVAEQLDGRIADATLGVMDPAGFVGR